MTVGNFVEKSRETPWGGELILLEGDEVTVKIITVNRGHRLSLQSHANRDEYWAVLSNSGGVLQKDDSETVASDGAKLIVPRGAKHRMSASKSGELKVLEISVGQFDQNDIVRFEDDYGRAGTTNSN